MIALLYSIIIFISTLLGAFVGLGGGVIIKPMLDLVHVHSVAMVDFISACAVFTMTIASTYKQIRSKTKFDLKIILCVALGSGLGGVLGSKAFDAVLRVSANPEIVRGIQALILALFLILVNVYINGKFPSFHVKNPLLIVMIGLFLGTTASFLGIGGGAINVAFLVLFFSFTMKEAAVYSVSVIFFSQFTKLCTLFVQNQFIPYDKTVLLYVLPCAVIGGIVGAMLNRRWDEKNIKKTFLICVYALVLVSFYNAFVAFTA